MNQIHYIFRHASVSSTYPGQSVARPSLVRTPKARVVASVNMRTVESNEVVAAVAFGSIGDREGWID